MKPGAAWRRWGPYGNGLVRSRLLDRIEIIPLGGATVPELEEAEDSAELSPGARLRRRLERWLQQPWPASLDLPWEALQPLYGDPMFLGTPGIEEHLGVLTGEPGPWSLHAGWPAGTAMVGFSGHGLNSYAFYLLLRQPGLLVHLRMGYGGLYSSQERDHFEIWQYVCALDAFLQASEADSTLRVACEGIDTGWSLRRWPGGGKAICTGVQCGRPDFSPLMTPD